MNIAGILNNTYSLTQEEIELEDQLWHNRIVYCRKVDIEYENKKSKTESNHNESKTEAKRKLAEYNHQYYITHRKKPKKEVIMTETAIKNRATMAKLRNRLCLYEGEEVKYGTLMARLHNKFGYSWPDAKKIADEHLTCN